MGGSHWRQGRAFDSMNAAGFSDFSPPVFIQATMTKAEVSIMSKLAWRIFQGARKCDDSDVTPYAPSSLQRPTLIYRGVICSMVSEINVPNTTSDLVVPYVI